MDYTRPESLAGVVTGLNLMREEPYVRLQWEVASQPRRWPHLNRLLQDFRYEKYAYGKLTGGRHRADLLQ